MVSFQIDGDKLLEKYKTVLIKIKGLRNITLNALPIYKGEHKCVQCH